jgi:hypothetical protein
MMNIDHLSLVTTPVFLRKGEELVSQGTGFYYFHKWNEESWGIYLVTNHHVLTGSAPSENKATIGNNIIFQFHQSPNETSKVKTIHLPLFAKHGQPIWVNSHETPEADLAVVPLASSLYQDCKLNCICEEWATTNLRVSPTSSVTLIGYPYGYYDKKNALPIWKTGNVASEPNVDFEGKPYFLIDISAFPRMSGSPVFAISHAFHVTEENIIEQGSARRFLGIYASMQMVEQKKYLEELVHISGFGIKDRESLELGHVWKASLIIQTVKNIDVERYEKEILRNLDSCTFNNSYAECGC